MAEKAKKTIPWLMILALIGLTTVGVNFLSSEVEAGAEQSTAPSGTVNNVGPTVSAVNITEPTITLTENATTTVTITATITDTNSSSDVDSATATFYLITEGTDCSADDNNCYPDISCTIATSSGNDATATCITYDVQFHAIASTTGWGAYVLGADDDAATSSATDTTPSTVSTLLALVVGGTITYDALDPGSNMASTTKALNATTTGNAAIDVQIKGDAMTYGATGTIAIENQRFSTTTDDAWASADTASSSYVTVGVDMAKPTAAPSNQGEIIYWAWGVPDTTPDGSYSGTNYFTAVTAL